MEFPGNLPQNVKLLPATAKELAKILHKDPENFRRIFQDVTRLVLGTLPPQGRKRLRNFNAYQFDCGRFRVVYRQQGSTFLILAVFAKSEQKKRFKGWR